jgi:hypothetical protein
MLLKNLTLEEESLTLQELADQIPLQILPDH